MPDMDKVIKGLEKAKIVIEAWIPMFEQYNTPAVIDEALKLLKEQDAEIRQLKKVAEKIKAQEPKEMTTDEWYEWKKNPKRDPVCLLWEHDTTPMWVLNPNDVHESAFLMGKLKLFAGKPTHEQCKAVKWDASCKIGQIRAN